MKRNNFTLELRSEFQPTPRPGTRCQLGKHAFEGHVLCQRSFGSPPGCRVPKVRFIWFLRVPHSTRSGPQCKHAVECDKEMGRRQAYRGPPLSDFQSATGCRTTRRRVADGLVRRGAVPRPHAGATQDCESAACARRKRANSRRRQKRSVVHSMTMSRGAVDRNTRIPHKGFWEGPDFVGTLRFYLDLRFLAHEVSFPQLATNSYRAPVSPPANTTHGQKIITGCSAYTEPAGSRPIRIRLLPPSPTQNARLRTAYSVFFRRRKAYLGNASLSLSPSSRGLRRSTSRGRRRFRRGHHKTCERPQLDQFSEWRLVVPGTRLRNGPSETCGALCFGTAGPGGGCFSRGEGIADVSRRPSNQVSSEDIFSSRISAAASATKQPFIQQSRVFKGAILSFVLPSK